ncbi:hypothetical protein AOQ71_06490 [Bradyrhizobium manausense]|uniref:Uncharacterized protein n=1 Tax=Bradyrhizobium manausense TaxID=989370 RepID=A0A0R3E1Y9_9BRAD|nr:hypothetical protein AOQ71_06490 [Bradyrhizobium manausense]
MRLVSANRRRRNVLGFRDGCVVASHQTKDESVRYDGAEVSSTNTVAGYYSIFKRGMKGV